MDIASLYSIKGKVALVTGGGSGIGTMATEALVRAGVKVYIASRKLENCQTVADELNPIGPGNVVPLAADLSTGEGTQALVDAISAQEDKIDILVNNSGTTWGAPLDDFPREKWDQVLGLNVTAVADLTRLMLPLLRKSGTGDDPARIVNVGSIVGHRPITNMAYSYGASKAAVHHITKMFSHELAGENITVNAIAPGPFPSRMMAFVTENEKMRKATEENVPLGRLGRPDDVAGVLLMLTSRAGSYITGAIIPLDGGGSAKP
jgi:NAD(P)-dependent dehydrogenase (short-subunit alcohol dehydrogenase family)